MQTERVILPREGLPQVEVPNRSGLVPGSDASLRRATENWPTAAARIRAMPAIESGASCAPALTREVAIVSDLFSRLYA
jgi:hypothetical protein